jgi:hypothetical protein
MTATRETPMRLEAKDTISRLGGLRAPLACAAAALVLASVAGAANSSSFADPAGDVGLASDVTGVDISNDDAGTLAFRVAVAPGRTIGLPGDEVGVALDLDQNPDTGTVFYGTEVGIVFDETTLYFLRADGARFSEAARPPSLQGSITDGFVTLSVKAADLGLASTDGFNVFAVSHSYRSGDTDTAPDIRTVNYEQVAGTPAKVLGPDTRAPLDRAFPARGVHGKRIELDYWVADGRGMTADTLRIYRRGTLLRTIHVSLGDVNPFFFYYQTWRVPRTIRGRLRFCVRSVDAAGNRSNQSCARLRIR